MTEFKGTRVEWQMSPSSENFISDITDQFPIAKVFDNSFIQKGESEANAKLIACAPLMLEMLIILIPTLKQRMLFETASEIEALIKKATE